MGPRWRSYFRDCQAAGREPSSGPSWIPEPLPGVNAQAWRAFGKIRYCRISHGFGLGGFDWVAVAERLKLHGLWTREIEEKLEFLEAEMMTAESKFSNTEKD